MWQLIHLGTALQTGGVIPSGDFFLFPKASEWRMVNVILHSSATNTVRMGFVNEREFYTPTTVVTTGYDPGAAIIDDIFKVDPINNESGLTQRVIDGLTQIDWTFSEDIQPTYFVMRAGENDTDYLVSGEIEYKNEGGAWVPLLDFAHITGSSGADNRTVQMVDLPTSNMVAVQEKDTGLNLVVNQSRRLSSVRSSNTELVITKHKANALIAEVETTLVLEPTP